MVLLTKNNLLRHTNKSFLHFYANLERNKNYRMKTRVNDRMSRTKQQPVPTRLMSKHFFRSCLVITGIVISRCVTAQSPSPEAVYAANIGTPQLYLPGNQLGYPV